MKSRTESEAEQEAKFILGIVCLMSFIGGILAGIHYLTGL